MYILQQYSCLEYDEIILAVHDCSGQLIDSRVASPGNNEKETVDELRSMYPSMSEMPSVTVVPDSFHTLLEMYNLY